MENFYFNSVQFLLGEITSLIRVSHHNMRVEAEYGGPAATQVANDPELAKAIQQSADTVKFASEGAGRLFSSLKCAHIDRAAERLHRWPRRSPPQWSELNTRSRALRDAIVTELKDYSFYQYPKANGLKLQAFKTEWQSALDAFPSIEQDAFRATDCFALQQGTACVFHCMRVLEIGLRIISADLGLTFELQQWNTIIEQIESRITAQRKSAPQSREKSERFQFLSEIAKEFYYFKDGWRNYVSHGRGEYDGAQALKVLEHTQAFMNRLSTGLSER